MTEIFQPSISIIIPTYRRSAHLEEALRSLAAQTYPAAEVIVVDDCSPDPVELPPVAGLEVTLLRHARNQGAGAARNTGLAHATGDWIGFLDDDDLFMPNRLELAVRGMGDARMHAVALESFDESGVVGRGSEFSGDLRGCFLDGSKPYGGIPQLGQVILHRADVVQFNPRLRRAQDTEWWLRMTDRAVFSWSPEVGVRFRVHGEDRQYLNAQYMADVRDGLARSYGPSSTPTRRAHLYRRAATAALWAGKRWSGAFWSAKSLLARPTRHGGKLLGISLVRGKLRMEAYKDGRGKTHRTQGSS